MLEHHTGFCIGAIHLIWTGQGCNFLQLAAAAESCRRLVNYLARLSGKLTAARVSYLLVFTEDSGQSCSRSLICFSLKMDD